VAAADVAQANIIVQYLNGFSSTAHISGMGLKVMVVIAPFSNLRTVNLSGIGKHCHCKPERSIKHCQFLLFQTVKLSDFQKLDSTASVAEFGCHVHVVHISSRSLPKGLHSLDLSRKRSQMSRGSGN
jgi:hypothetical protein